MPRDYLLKPRPLQAIISDVAQKHGLTYEQLVERSRIRALAWPRQEAMWRCAKETKSSLYSIGRVLGCLDSTTVRHGISRYEQRVRRHEQRVKAGF